MVVQSGINSSERRINSLLLLNIYFIPRITVDVIELKVEKNTKLCLSFGCLFFSLFYEEDSYILINQYFFAFFIIQSDK